MLLPPARSATIRDEPNDIKKAYENAKYFVVTFIHYYFLWGVIMSITTFSSRDFNQGTNDAKRATKNGPVFITDRGKPAHVLMSFEDYQRLTKQRRSIVDALSMAGIADVAFEPPRLTIDTRLADLS